MLERPELKLLAAEGIQFGDPSEAVDLFERKMAALCGSAFGVAVDCATHAIELSLRYLGASGKVSVPRHTYPSVPMALLRIGCELNWVSEEWSGSYSLQPWPVVDSSLRLAPGIHRPGDFTCLSFQHKKRIPIGRGGMILTDDERAYRWLKKASHDGRTPGLRWHDDNIDMLGWHYYMTPEDAARGLLLLGTTKDFSDLGGWGNYPDLTNFSFFKGSI
jgi:dTDP-4-amino-4,6-dideoxygalactose transaminase